MRKKLLVGMLACTIAFSGMTFQSGHSFSMVHAAETSTQSGIVNFGRGEASITIQGNTGQSLIGKKFQIFKLFQAENSVHG